jgi:hypothetical protein
LERDLGFSFFIPCFYLWKKFLSHRSGTGTKTMTYFLWSDTPVTVVLGQKPDLRVPRDQAWPLNPILQTGDKWWLIQEGTGD